MVARAKWEKFSAIFCNIFTKKKTPENTMSLRTSVVLRAANQNSNDCQWQSYLDLCNTGVAPSGDSLRSQSPSCSENPHRTRRGRCPHRPEMKTYAYTPTLHKCFGAGSSGGNVLVSARTLRRSRLRGRCRKAAPLRTPRPHRRKQARMFQHASGESIEKSLKDTMSLRTSGAPRSESES